MTAGPFFRGHRVVRLYVLDLGLFEVRGGERVIGIPGFLVQTDRGANLLIDTGFPPSYATDSGIAARDGLPGFGRLIDFSARQTAVGQLALLGLRPEDIDLVVLSHGHIDHVGSLPLFRCPVLMTRTERADPRPSYFGKARPMVWPETVYHLIDDDTDLCAGLTLIPTPGHTPGHLSVRVALPETGPVILAIDAINRASEPAEGFADAADPVAAQASAARLFGLAADGGLLIFGHDPAQWPGLRKAPAFFA
ncbi:N-acyl homoserine lactonase family protein [Tabrizicola sp.]|uniref:N-acyl homoserine lactonase family protein n=1 Tax=Tabrizicola sp. TaxID=2005166 RepID=UPI00286C1B73|nr:N-acyl homoserine lactonase family protein [Tabrizicola sp.]